MELLREGKVQYDVSLREGEVHLWWARWTDVGAARFAFDAVLAPDELARAQRFRSPSARDEFVTWRGTLRHLLGRYLGMRPASLRFDYGAHGKPALLTEEGTRAGLDSVRFNVSHADGCAVFAVTLGCGLGVDVERIRQVPDAQTVAAVAFGMDERAALATTPPEARSLTFLRTWTRREAYLKARGVGLTAPPDALTVVWRDGGIWECTDVGPGGTTGPWTLRETATSTHVAAVAVERSHWKLVEGTCRCEQRFIPEVVR